MIEKSSRLASDLWPYLLPRIERLVQLGVSGDGGGSVVSGAPTPHALNSTHHSGILADSQGPQFLKLDGSRALAGHLSAAAGITFDGVDVSAHAANANAHHAAATAGDGIDLTGQQIAVDVTDFIDTAYGLTESANNIRIDLDSPSGLQLTSGLALADAIAGNGLTITAKVLAVGAGNGISVAASSVAVNQAYAFAWTAAHTHAGNVTFTGAARTITSDGGYDLTLAAAGDLVLNPTGNVQLPNAQELRTTDFSDLVTGIAGLRLWDRGSNYRQLTMGAIKVDELYARVFVADEVRIDRGEEYWSKSYGIVETDFVTPAVGGDIAIWFEDAPALAGNIFGVNDRILFRTIDWGTGIVIAKYWFYVRYWNADDTTNKRQQWVLRLLSGSVGATVKKGSLGLDVGTSGQGWVHLSALDQDGGPFIQLGDWDSAGGTKEPSDSTAWTNRVRIGNLNGVGGIAVDTWGFAAAKNLGTTIGSGFEGIVMDPTNGVRLYNSRINTYSGSTQTGSWAPTGTLWLGVSTTDRRIEWDGTKLTIVGELYVASNSRLDGPVTLATGGGIYQGTGTFASPTTGLKIWNDGGIGRIGGYNAGVAQWYANTNGRLYAGAGKLVLDTNGLSFAVQSAFTKETSIDWMSGTTSLGRLSYWNPGGGATGWMEIANDSNDKLNTIYLHAVANTTQGASVQLGADGDGGVRSAFLSVSGYYGSLSSILLRAEEMIFDGPLTAFDAGGLVFEDDGGNVGLELLDGGILRGLFGLQLATTDHRDSGVNAIVSAGVSVTGANVPIASLSNATAGTTDYAGIVIIWARNNTGSSANSAVYTYQVMKATSGSGYAVEIAKSGLTAGAGASHPSFTFTVDAANNHLEASVVGSTTGTFYFGVTALGHLRATAL